MPPPTETLPATSVRSTHGKAGALARIMLRAPSSSSSDCAAAPAVAMKPGEAQAHAQAGGGKGSSACGGCHNTVAGMGGAAAFFAARRAFSAARRHAPKLGYPSRSQSSDCWLWRCSGGRMQPFGTSRNFRAPGRSCPASCEIIARCGNQLRWKKAPTGWATFSPSRKPLSFRRRSLGPPLHGNEFRQVAGG